LLATKFTKRSSSRRDQIPLNEVIESALKTVPSRAERASRRYVVWESRVEPAQTGNEHTTVGLGEEHGNPATHTGALIPLRACDFGDQSLAP